MIRERMFPVHRDDDGIFRQVPWRLLAPHYEWAERNHQQTLQRLAERGGLSLCEMVAIIEHTKYLAMPAEVAQRRIWDAIQSLPAADDSNPIGGMP